VKRQYENGFEKASTSIVGLLTDGQTPEGFMDMSGNVWEWMNNWWDDDDTLRVVRGGSWGLDRRDVRCASRLRGAPDCFFDIIGFRVVSPG
jgi:formylglycine-generating enzyme required for sulfatase activity